MCKGQPVSGHTVIGYTGISVNHFMPEFSAQCTLQKDEGSIWLTITSHVK